MRRAKTRRTLRNGDVVEVGLVRHKGGETSIKRSMVACGVRPKRAARPISLPPDPMKPAPSTKTAKRKQKKAATVADKQITAAPATVRERTHHEDARSIDKSAYVTTTNQVPRTLKRIRARTGNHIEAFQRDFELVGSDLKSFDLAGVSGGGGGTPFPQAKVEAVDRLRQFEQRNMVAFKMCEAVLIHGMTPASIHAAGGPQHVVVSHMIREAVEDLSEFYTPNRKRPDKMLAVLTKAIESAKRDRA